MGVKVTAAAIRKNRNIKAKVKLVKKELGGATTCIWRLLVQCAKQAAHQGRLSTYRRTDHNPASVRQIILNSLHKTHPGSVAMLDLSEKIWFAHIHRTIVQTAQNCRQCTDQDRQKLMYSPLQSEIMHDLQYWSEREVKITRIPIKNLSEPSNKSLKAVELSSRLNTCVK